MKTRHLNLSEVYRSVFGSGHFVATHQCTALLASRSINAAPWCPRRKNRVSEANGSACAPRCSSLEILPFAQTFSNPKFNSPLPLNADCARLFALSTTLRAVLRYATALRVTAPRDSAIRLIRG